MKWTLEIQCSNCGAREEVPNDLEEIGKRAEVWGSFGNALYCPECRRTWSERNSKPLAGYKNTFSLIAYKFFRKYEGR